MLHYGEDTVGIVERTSSLAQPTHRGMDELVVVILHHRAVSYSVRKIDQNHTIGASVVNDVVRFDIRMAIATIP